jgi:hypothetical protein
MEHRETEPPIEAPPIQRISGSELSDPSSAFDPIEVTMKEDSDDCIPRRGVFSTLVTGAHPIPLFRDDFIPRNVCTTVAFNLNEVRNRPENQRRGQRGPQE